jgi:hypothetical protein
MQDQQLTTLIIRMKRDQGRGNQSNVSADGLGEKSTAALARWTARCMSDCNVDRGTVTNADRSRLVDELMRINLIQTGDRNVDPVSAVALTKDGVRTAIERSLIGRY